MIEVKNIKRRKLVSPPKPVITKLGDAWLSAADALARLASGSGGVANAQTAIVDCLRSGKLRGFAHELNLIDAKDWGKDAKRDLSRAERAGFVHSTWLGPYPESIGLTEEFWRQSPNPALETPNWDWADGNFVAGMFGKNLKPKNQYWIARSIVFNAFEIECMGLQHEAATVSNVDKGGRPLATKWTDWVAEWVFYIHENGLPADSEPKMLAKTLDDLLAKRGKGKIENRPVIETIEATLSYMRSKMGKPQKSDFSE
ncbi:hypothetical protein [Sphingobium sp. CAP-1]|uniref:hypothetical protein n=1 Tax=Sphingobium sp. CAP-1 TaxID=2676077 RepID=UPI0012BB287F|nr:hypothetical protein [Sphingobium sp. CAP-1]QGP79579.1 hypothetical protein GL174_11765 [Sphingobium sp. CAP-1]